MPAPPTENEGLSDREKQTRLRAMAFLAIGLPIVGYGLSVAVSERNLAFAAIAICTLLAITIGAIVLWRHRGGYQAIRPGIACHTVLVLYLVAHSGAEHALALWFLTVPIVSIMLLPPREGVAWSLGSIVVATYLMVHAADLYGGLPYTTGFIVRYTILALLITGVLCWSEILLERYQIRLRDQNAALMIERDHLEEEIVRRSALEEELRYLATTDSLTGLLNRRAFMSALAGELMRCQRLNSPMTLLMIDVDHFKQINDRHGHPAGDAVLVHIAQLLQAELRTIDRLGRIGSEEFAIMLVDTGPEPAETVIQRLLEAIRGRPAEHPETHLPIALTASIGCTASHPQDDELTSMSRADRALYAAKQGGRNRHHWV